MIMSDFVFSVNVVAPLFMLIAAGYVAKCLRFLSPVFLSDANKFTFKFLLPVLLFQNIQVAFRGDFSNTRLIFAALAGVLVVIALLHIAVLPVKGRGAKGSMIQGIYRSNFLIYGVPLATSMYGHDAMVPVAMLMGVIIPVYNIAAVVILTVFSEKRPVSLSLKNIIVDILRNPLIIACIAGSIAGVLDLRFPTVINKPLDDLATIATPLALLIMGGEFRFRSLQNNFAKVFLASLGRLVIVPLLAIIVFIHVGFRDMELAALLSLFATPTAVTSFIMAENMGCDGELSAQIVVLTTALSAFTIFAFVFVLKSLGYF
jgi:predicted permease